MTTAQQIQYIIEDYPGMTVSIELDEGLFAARLETPAGPDAVVVASGTGYTVEDAMENLATDLVELEESD